MSFNISIASHNLKFEADTNRILLDAALGAKINMPYGCKTGVCGACKCKVLSGNVVHDEYNSAVLNKQDLADNYILPCRAKAISDLVISLPEFKNTQSAKIFLSKVIEINNYGNVIVAKLKIPDNQQFSFIPGQYVEIIHNKVSRFYSIANATEKTQQIELHIKLHPDGVFSNQFWAKLKIGQIVRFKGPLGRFYLKESLAPILMVCTGTGFAPVKSIVEEMLANNNNRKINLVCGNYDPSDFYLSELLNKWQEHTNINITLCTSRTSADGFFSGQVTDYIINNFTNLNDYELYACGSSNMIKDVYDLSVNQLNLHKENFFSDTFLAAV